MKKERMLLAFLRRDRALLFALGCVLLVFALVFSLYRLPVEAVGYAALIALIPIGITGVLRYHKYKDRLRSVGIMTREIEAQALTLPEADDKLECEYQALTSRLDELMRAARTELDRNKEESMDYFTLWAHQIKTPIAAMRLLLQAQDKPDENELKTQLFLIEQYVELAMGYQRLDSGMNDLVLKTCSLDSIVKTAVRKYARLFILKKLTLRYQPIAVTVLTDEKWLGFVIEQILSNAIKYTRQGGVLIELIGGSTLVIRDTGIGVSAEDLPRICERGYTGYNGRADTKSTGIGLYLCRRVMDKLGHGLRFESQVGQGTSVYLALGRRRMTVE